MEALTEDVLLHLAAERALELPSSTQDHPFGPETTVFRIRGKLFALLMGHEGARFVNLKARPEDGAELRRALPDVVRPGWHMDKRHWISVHAGDGLDKALLRDLVTESYLLVVASLPRAARPVDPETFGRR